MSSVKLASALEEFRFSAIPERLTLANVQVIEGDAAIEVLTEHAIAAAQNVTSYRTRPVIKLLNNYQFAAAGGWIAYGCTLEGERGSVAMFKPLKPRQSKGFDTHKTKTIKYETPLKCHGQPILPWVDDETATAIYKRYNIAPERGENFWQAVLRCNLPIAITEGLKKALALIAHGIPAIAIRGISQWRIPKTDQLNPVIEQFATPGRETYIVFDQDEKIRTQIDVRTQIKKLGAALEKLGCKARVMVWDGALGKGVDDALYGQAEHAQTWLTNAVGSALTLKQHAAEGGKAAALATLRRLSESRYPIERITEGEYLPELPSLQRRAIHALSAAMNTGKTTRIGADWVGEAKRRGWLTLVLAPLNSLGKQTAQDWDLPHIHDFSTDAEQQRLLWDTAAHDGGVVMCPDSLHRLPNWFLERPMLLICDEGNAVIDHMTQGATLGDRWSLILEKFAAVAAHAAATGAIVLSEDGLPDRAINFVQAVSGAQSVRVFRHYKRGVPWDCQVMTGQASGFRSRLIQTVMAGDRLLVVSSSQRECRRLERVLSKIAPHLKAVRIDSETNQSGAFDPFFRNPDRWLQEHNPDVLILSPSAKSGVSIEGNVSAEAAYFSSVWGYFPALDTDSQMQLLGRYRPAVPRFIFVPPFIQGNSEEALHTPRTITRRLQLNASALSGVYEIEAALDSERSDRHIEIEVAALDYLAQSLAVSGAQKGIAHDALVARLEAAGHCVERLKVEKCSATVERWKQVTEEIWQDDAAQAAAVQLDPNIHTPQWAHDVLNGLESTRDDRLIAQKVMLREEFLGVAFDSSDEWYQAIYSDYGKMRRGVNLQARSENLDGAKERDRGAAQSILTAKIRALHRLPRNHVKAVLLQKTGILNLLDGTPYSNLDKRAIAIKAAALKWAKEISYWLRLTINDTQTPVEICNKLLKKLGLEGRAIARPGKRGEQSNRVYRVEGQDNPIRQRLLEAARLKLFESVSMTRIRYEQSHLRVMDTPQKPPDIGEWARPGALDDARAAIALATGDAEALEYLKSITPNEVWQAIAS